MDVSTAAVFTIPDFPAITIGFIVFFLGAFLTRHIAFLRNYNIPEPVSGGIAVALFTWAAFAWFGTEVVFDLSTRDELLVLFFTTIGLNARLSDLIAGGRLLLILLVMTIAFIVVQNCVGLLGATLFGFPKAIGVLVGSASLIGGHGTAIAWGPTIQAETGFAAASEIGIAAATLGLILAALIGGPIAKYLIDRNGLKSTATDGAIVGMPYEIGDEDARNGGPKSQGDINHITLMRVLLATNIAIIIGYIAHQAITAWGLKLPLFVPCLLAGILLSNTVPYAFPKLPWPARTPALAMVSDYCLSLFLAMSLMSMQLWTLSELGGPLIGILAMQVAATTLLVIFVFFRATGSDYTAAVLSAGFAGFTLGATPTAIANMSSVTKRYGPAPLAFIVLPLVSAFFVDIANAFAIRYFAAF
jgi:glutamate:Na+ symporter, ESS family